MTTAYDPQADWAREDRNERMARDELRAEVRLSWDGGDPWGSVLSALGGMLDVLEHAGRPDLVPDSAGYTLGAGVPAVEDYPAAYYLELLDNGATTTAALAYWARVLDRFADAVPEDRRY